MTLRNIFNFFRFVAVAYFANGVRTVVGGVVARASVVVDIEYVVVIVM